MDSLLVFACLEANQLALAALVALRFLSYSLMSSFLVEVYSNILLGTSPITLSYSSLCWGLGGNGAPRVFDGL